MGEIRHPELVGHGRHELPVDLVIRARLRWVGNGCLLLASHNPLQSMKTHEPLHGATRDVVPVTPKLMPDLAGTVAPPALAMGRLDLPDVHSVLPGAIRGKPGIVRDGGMAMEGCRGDLQNTADRLSITVVSTATRLVLSSSIMPDFCPARIVWVSSHSTPSSSIRPRQRVSEDGSIGGRCWKNVSPVKC